MKKLAGWIPTVLAAIVLLLTFLNANHFAPLPEGRLRLLAQEGIHQWFDRASVAPGDCTAARIEQPYHSLLDNSQDALKASMFIGARMVELPIAPTSDGQFVAFSDETLDCRTDGKGKVSEHSLAELKALDAGYGYTADGGESFPFRGKGKGGILSLDEAVEAASEKPLLYRLATDDASIAEGFAKALKQSGRNVSARRDGFFAPPKAAAALRTAFPDAWVFSEDDARACTRDYAWLGWLAITPPSCRNGSLIVSLDSKWPLSGWPNRTVARMDAVGAKIIVIAREDAHGRPIGIDLPEHLPKVPASYNGFLLVDDIWTIGPTLHPDLDQRTYEESVVQDEVLERRRKLRGHE